MQLVWSTYDNLHTQCYFFSNKASNPCQSGPCGNGATCINKVNSYWCVCTDGWTDPLCLTGWLILSSMNIKLILFYFTKNIKICSRLCSKIWWHTCNVLFIFYFKIERLMSVNLFLVNGTTCMNFQTCYTFTCTGWEGINCAKCKCSH